MEAVVDMEVVDVAAEDAAENRDRIRSDTGDDTMRRKNQRQKANSGLNQNRCGQVNQGQSRTSQTPANGHSGRGRCRR